MKDCSPVLLLDAIIILMIVPTSKAEPIQSEAAEIKNFAEEKIRAELHTAGDTWVNAGNGGYLLRAEVDITGDNRPEVLITSTLDLHRGLTNWRVFETETGGSLRRYEEPYLGGVNVYRPARDAAGDFVLLQYDRWQRHLAIVKFKNGRQERSFIADNSPEWDDETHPFLNYETKWPDIQFQVEGIKLCDYVTGKTNWKAINFDDPAPFTEYYFIPAQDGEDMKANKAFTPEVALQMLRALKPADSGTPTAAGKQYPLPALGNDSGSGSDGKEGNSPFSSAYAGLWVGFAFLIAAVAVWFKMLRSGNCGSNQK